MSTDDRLDDRIIKTAKARMKAQGAVGTLEIIEDLARVGIIVGPHRVHRVMEEFFGSPTTKE